MSSQYKFSVTQKAQTVGECTTMDGKERLKAERKGLSVSPLNSSTFWAKKSYKLYMFDHDVSNYWGKEPNPTPVEYNFTSTPIAWTIFECSNVVLRKTRVCQRQDGH